MEKINFQDLPSTDTPINSTNLNQMQANIEEEITPVSYDISNTPEHSAGTNIYQLTKTGKIVSLNVNAIWLNSITENTWLSFGTIPEGIIPTKTQNATAILTEGGNGNIIGYAKVESSPDRSLKFKPNIAYTKLCSSSFSMVWTL